MKKRRIIAVSDMHCGSRAGLTPPNYWGNPKNEFDKKWVAMQREQWNWYVKTINELKPFDVAIFMGDLVDGKATKSNGRDVIRKERREQVTMAIDCINELKCPNKTFVNGTRYHTEDDWEWDIAEHYRVEGDRVKQGAHEWVEIECKKGDNVIFDCKHHIGSSQIPHGRATAIMRDGLWNQIWADIDMQPRGQFLLRGHAHFFLAVKQYGVWHLRVPALQGMGSEFGGERCSGTVDYGLIYFDVYEDGHVEWEERLASIKAHKAKTTKY